MWKTPNRSATEQVHSLVHSHQNRDQNKQQRCGRQEHCKRKGRAREGRERRKATSLGCDRMPPMDAQSAFRLPGTTKAHICGLFLLCPECIDKHCSRLGSQYRRMFSSSIWPWRQKLRHPSTKGAEMTTGLFIG